MRHLVVKFVTNAQCTWWPKLKPMLIALHVGPIWNQFWWHHLLVKFWTNTSGTNYNWPNLEPIKVAFYLAGEITQVKELIPWVRCASGNVLCISCVFLCLVVLFFCPCLCHAMPFCGHIDQQISANTIDQQILVSWFWFSVFLILSWKRY